MEPWRQKPVAPLTINELAVRLGLGVPEGTGQTVLTDVRTLFDAEGSHLSFFDNSIYRHGARTTRAAAVLVRPQDADVLPPECIALVTPTPYVSFALALQAFYPFPVPEPGRHESTLVAESATLHPTARLEPGVVVYPGASIGARVHIGAYTVVGRGVQIGDNTVIGAHCSLHKTSLGVGCILHPGVRIGQDGFGFALQNNHLLKVPQVGGVRIGNDVEIGANTTIDCGALGDTVIEDMVKIDNQVQIGHNVRIGQGTRIVAQTGIAGSATLGAFNVIGGQSGIAGHIALADRVMVAARSGVTKTVASVGAVVAGIPAEPIQNWRKKVAVLSRLTKQAKERNRAGGTPTAEDAGDL